MPAPPSVDEVKDNLKRMRRGFGLARPTTLVSAADESVRRYLGRDCTLEPDSTGYHQWLTRVLRNGIDRLHGGERRYVEVDFNLDPIHSFATLTDRQESLARELRCAVKTVRRRSDQALATLAFLLVADSESSPPRTAVTSSPERGEEQSPDLARWGLHASGGIDIVCSEIPADERPDYASPADRNYLRYAKFADLDTLIYVRTRLAQLAPTAIVRDFAPSEHFGTDAEVLVVIGGPPWNAKFREFLPQLPFHFEPHPLGEDDPLVILGLDNSVLAPRWTFAGVLIDDLAVLTRLTVQDTTIFLLGGCLTLGVLGAARCLLDPVRGAVGNGYLTDRVEDTDFVLITEARRLGGIVDVSDLSVVEPLVLLSRPVGRDWKVLIDNSVRRAPDVT